MVRGKRSRQHRYLWNSAVVHCRGGQRQVWALNVVVVGSELEEGEHMVRGGKEQGGMP